MRYSIFLFLIFQISLNAQLNDSLIENARKYLYENEVHHKPIYIDSVEHEIKEMPYVMARKYYVFNGEIKTPLIKTKFLHFSINKMDPMPSYIVALYKDSLALLIEWGCSEGYACEKVIMFLNRRLKEEKVLDENQLSDLAYALVKISFPAWNFYRIISSYDDVSWIGDNNKLMYLPDSLKKIIKPMMIKKENNIIELEYYLWNEVILKKIFLHYQNNQLDIKIKPVWNSGRRLMIG
jgi:hypothetical protein